MKAFVVVIGALLLLSACTPTAQDTNTQNGVNESPQETSFTSLAQREVKELEDGTSYIVHPDEIQSGGPPQDGIPSIDEPTFVSVQEADDWIADDELVLALTYQGVTRAYPLQILVWHEIVNDEFADERILVTYCPLCGTGIAYKPLVEGQEVEFGTSGKLWQSNLVMYDRLTESYWSQIDGVSILGSQAGNQLEAIPIDTVVWGEWKQHNQDAQVLSQDTGHSRNYGEDPYGNYYEDSFIMFPVHEEDNRVHPKTVIYSFVLEGQATAYRVEDVREEQEITDTVAGVAVRITREDDGTVTVIREDTNQEIAKERGFWFSWYAFHPDTKLYGVEPQNQ